MQIEKISFNGWRNCIRLRNADMELVITTDVGPRVIRCGFIGQPNLFAEIAGQQGGAGEPEWKIRGGHRLWIAPEDKTISYELDNVPVSWRTVDGAVLLDQPPGPASKISKHLAIRLDDRRNQARVRHILRNRGDAPCRAAPWALTVMPPGARLIVPLPPKETHGRDNRFEPNQIWSIWPCTDLADGRWQFGSRYLFFQQRTDRDAGKLGMSLREGWVAGQLPGGVFVKRFDWLPGAVYPDGNVNFETFANREILEIETLGPLVELAPGAEVVHEETWELLTPLPPLQTEKDVTRHLRPLVAQSATNA